MTSFCLQEPPVPSGSAGSCCWVHTTHWHLLSFCRGTPCESLSTGQETHHPRRQTHSIRACIWGHSQAFQWAPHLNVSLLPSLCKDYSSYMDPRFPQEAFFPARWTYGREAELRFSRSVPDGGEPGLGYPGPAARWLWREQRPRLISCLKLSAENDPQNNVLKY